MGRSVLALEFLVLGPLQVRVGDLNVRVAGQLSRRALALLLMHATEVVSDDSLVDALWTDGPPRTAAACLHNVVAECARC